MTTRLLLVRHGATTLNAEDRFAGSTDVPLGPDGFHQARRLAERLAPEPIAAIYTSPMRRTIETATILAEPHGLALTPADGLREVDHGRWERLTRAQVEARYPGEYAAWEHDPLQVAPEGGESGRVVLARAMTAVRAIVATHWGEQVLVVSHKATIRLLVARLLGLDARGYRDRLELLPAGLTVIDIERVDRARLVLFNDVAHYSYACAS